MDYKLVRSNRKTLGINVSSNGEITVRAPLFLSDEIIEKEIEKAENWIIKAVERQKNKKNSVMNTDFDEETVKALRIKAAEIVIPLVEKYSKLMKVAPTGVKITSARTRYGSCSGSDSLCFSYRLALFPLEAVEAVVVHELAHIKHKNHGKRFYALVYKTMPDYDDRKRMLKS